jgi:hypothetical protein
LRALRALIASDAPLRDRRVKRTFSK